MLLLFDIQITGCSFSSNGSSLWSPFARQMGHKPRQHVAQGDLQSGLSLLVLMGDVSGCTAQ